MSEAQRPMLPSGSAIVAPIILSCHSPPLVHPDLFHPHPPREGLFFSLFNLGFLFSPFLLIPTACACLPPRVQRHYSGDHTFLSARWGQKQGACHNPLRRPTPYVCGFPSVFRHPTTHCQRCEPKEGGFAGNLIRSRVACCHQPHPSCVSCGAVGFQEHGLGDC